MPSVQEGTPSNLLLGVLAMAMPDSGGPEFARYMSETGSIADCPTGVPVRDLPVDCREVAPTPQGLFEKLDDWGHESMVIPHGTKNRVANVHDADALFGRPNPVVDLSEHCLGTLQRQ